MSDLLLNAVFKYPKISCGEIRHVRAGCRYRVNRHQNHRSIHTEMLARNCIGIEIHRGRARNDGNERPARWRLTRTDLAKAKQSDNAYRRIKRSSHGEIVYQWRSSWGTNVRRLNSLGSVENERANICVGGTARQLVKVF